MSIVSPARATLADLAKHDGKAELIGGMVVPLVASGWMPSQTAFQLAILLHDYAQPRGLGAVCAGGLGYAVPELSSGRESFEPDVSLFNGQLPARRIRFIEGTPTFAVEVRSENDYGPAAEQELADKRADYFEAGTLAVWDVDTEAETVTLYRHDAPTTAVVFRQGDTAHAEPAVPGWQVTVADVFDV